MRTKHQLRGPGVLSSVRQKIEESDEAPDRRESEEPRIANRYSLENPAG